MPPWIQFPRPALTLRPPHLVLDYPEVLHCPDCPPHRLAPPPPLTLPVQSLPMLRAILSDPEAQDFPLVLRSLTDPMVLALPLPRTLLKRLHCRLHRLPRVLRWHLPSRCFQSFRCFR